MFQGHVGGSGGGTGHVSGASGGAASTARGSTQGNAGGDNLSSYGYGGGGGGAGSSGSSAGSSAGGNGGNGVSYFGTIYSAGGGGGTFNGSTAATGGSSNTGGIGGTYTNAGGNGVSNTGSGGGGGGHAGTYPTPGNGSAGTVILVFRIAVSNSISSALSDGTQSVVYRTTKNIVVNVQNAGKATFSIYGKAIPGCKNIAAVGRGSSYSVTCAWKPSILGQVTVVVTFKPTYSQQPVLTSLLMNVAAAARGTPR